MTEEQKAGIQKLRTDGYGYTKIAGMLGLSENTVKSFCRRKGLNGIRAKKVAVLIGQGKHFRRGCRVEVVQNLGRKEKKFCSDKCRNQRWNSKMWEVRICVQSCAGSEDGCRECIY